MQAQDAEQVTYVEYDKLQNPSPDSIAYQVIQRGLESKQWKLNFDTITLLRQANRYYSNLFINQLLPRFYKQIVQQVQNLRSNNSKQGLKLLSEIFEHQNLDKIQTGIMKLFVTTVFGKTVSEKGFLKRQALKTVNFIPKKYNYCFVDELSQLTQSNNGSISELAIKILAEYIQNNKIQNFNDEFFQIQATNLQGKRAVLQKKARQILQIIKNQNSYQTLIEQIENKYKNNGISEDQRNILIRESKKDSGAKNTAQQQSFKDFLKLKKKSDSV